MIVAIILLSVGTLMVMVLMPLLSTSLQSGYKERELAMSRYAAEAGLNRVIADLIRGADAYPTTYITTSPHKLGTEPPYTFEITTSYTGTNVTVNDYTATVQISLPTESQAKPADQYNYVDPGVTHPDFAILEAGSTYIMRLYNVKAGIIQVNWAYSPEGKSTIGVWAGTPVDKDTDEPYPPGKHTGWPKEAPILETTKDNTDYIRTEAVVVDPAADDSGGVYTVVLYNSDKVDLTSKPFQPSGGTGDTWIYVKSYKDYIITATAGDISISAYVRQVPGFAEPPAWDTAWAVDNPSFITNEVYTYTWSPP